MIKEFRVPLPMSLEEYKIAQLYMCAKFSREKSSPSEGVQIVKNEPFEDSEKGLKGQYTHKIIFLGSQLPSWARSLLPASLLQAEEHSWNCYPYVKTEYKCSFFGEKFSIITESRFVDDDDGQIDNINNLSSSELKIREVEVIDICKETIPEAHYKIEEDPTKFKSEKTGRGPFQVGWVKGTKPRMCIYKTVRAKFEVWGFQNRVESYLLNNLTRGIMVLGYRQAVTWIDEWFDMNMDEIREYEEETQKILEKIMNENKNKN